MSALFQIEDCVANLRSTLPAEIRAVVEENSATDSHMSITELCKKLTEFGCDVNFLFQETFFRAIIDALHVEVG